MIRLVFIMCIILPCVPYAQEQDTSVSIIETGGNLSFLQSGVLGDSLLIDNQLQHRFTISCTLSASFHLEGALRTRILYGDSNKSVPGYAEGFDEDAGLADMAYVPIKNNSWLAAAQIDRMFGVYSSGKWQVMLGRQRINWGQCTVWNPNDIFNSYSVYDVDYTERPGSDACRIVYYRTYASQLEIAAKADALRRVTSALLYRFNKWNSDFQCIAGQIDEQDVVFAAGASGYWGAYSIRAELTYLRLMMSMADTSSMAILSAGTDRVLGCGLYMQAEALYNGNGDKLHQDRIAELYTQPSSVKNLSYDRYSCLIGARYPLTPLVQLSGTAMYYVRSDAYYLSPGTILSLTEDLDLSVIAHYFNTAYAGRRSGTCMAFWSMKYNF